MSFNSFALDSARVDYWGDWTALANEATETIWASDCYQPLLKIVPGQGQLVIPASGYQQFNFRLEVGSWILGLFEPGATVNPGILTQMFQLTDLCNGHQLIQDAGNGLFGTGAPQGENVSYMLFARPWRVMGSGLFSFEAWGLPGQISYVTLIVAEVKPCS